jgi:hypothetical protein
VRHPEGCLHPGLPSPAPVAWAHTKPGVAGEATIEPRTEGPAQSSPGREPGAADHTYEPSPEGAPLQGLSTYRGLRPRLCWNAPLGLTATGRGATTYTRNARHPTRARRNGICARTSPSPHLRHGIHPRDFVKDLLSKGLIWWSVDEGPSSARH